MTNRSNRDAKQGVAERRRPYEPPAVEDTVQFETLALTCGKIMPDDTCAYRSSGYDIS